MADTVEKQVKTKISFDGEADYKKAVADINSNLKTLNSEMKLVTAEYKANGASVETLKAKQETLQKVYAEQKAKVEATEKALERCRKETGENSDASKKLEQQLNYQKAALVGTEGELKKTAAELDDVEHEADETGKALKKSGDDSTDAANKYEGAAQKLKAVGAAIGAACAAIAAAAGAAIVGITKDAIANYAEYEQLVGGVETLFKDSAGQVQEYAANAYKTAGMSANEYMETVTGFSASLLQSLDGDTAKAAEKADMAITDMSDNANKMGSDLGSLQNAYAGFAKGQFNMLDNLKLGYGGTAAEMQRLLDDAEKVSGVKYDISSYADIVDAIHVVQTEMEITGTTAKEASSTISGSLASMQSAWQNLLTGMSDSEQDMGELVKNFTDSLVTVADNIAPRIIETVPRLVEGLGEIGKALAGYIPTMLKGLLPALMDGVKELATTVVNMLPEIFSILGEIVPLLVDAILTLLPQLLDAGMQIILQLAQGIAQALPTLIPTIVDVMLNIVTMLIDNIPLLIDAALQLVTGLAEGIIQAIPVIIERLPELITSIVNALVEGIPLLIEGAIQLFMALVQAIPVIIEALTAALPQIIQAIVNGLINGLPMIIEGSIQLFMALLEAIPVIVEALINALPQIVQAIATGLAAALPELAAWGANMLNGFVTIFSNVLNSVIQWGSNMLTQAVTSITAFVNGIINTAKDIPVKLYNAIIGAVAQVQQWGQRVLETAKNGMNMVKNGILNVFSNIGESFKTVGSNIVNGIWNGISAGWDWLKEKVSNIASSLLDAAKDALGIASPSKRFRDEVGVFMAQGIGVGFEQEMQSVSKQIEQAIPTDFDVTPHVTTGLSAADYAQENGQQPTLLSRGVTVIQNIYANTTDYAKQQREAEKNFRMIARTV